MEYQVFATVIASLIALLAAALFGIAAPLFKQSTMKIGEINLSTIKEKPRETISKIVKNKYFLIALILQLIGGLIFWTALSLTEVTLVVPIMSSTYVFTALYSRLVLKENITGKEAIGILIVLMGVVILTFPIT
ncbi:MAG: EamA family transporter [Candidatus Hodarchaeota archaeon]